MSRGHPQCFDRLWRRFPAGLPYMLLLASELRGVGVDELNFPCRRRSRVTSLSLSSLEASTTKMAHVRPGVLMIQRKTGFWLGTSSIRRGIALCVASRHKHVLVVIFNTEDLQARRSEGRGDFCAHVQQSIPSLVACVHEEEAQEEVGGPECMHLSLTRCTVSEAKAQGQRPATSQSN